MTAAWEGNVAEAERSEPGAGARPDSARASSESWARTPPARLVRGGVQRFALVPILKAIAPFTVDGNRNPAQLDGPAVFVANQQGHFDAPICLAAMGGKVRRRLLIAAAADYFYSTRVKGAAASLALGTVPFVRTGGS